MKKYIYKAVMYFSFQEREKREISNCLEEYKRLEELAEDELTARYILIKAKYRFKKNLFLFFILTVLLTAFSVWSFCFNSYRNLLQIIISNQTEIAETAKAVFLISGITFTAIIIAFVITVIFCLRALHDMNKKLLLIEEVKKNKENSCL